MPYKDKVKRKLYCQEYTKQHKEKKRLYDKVYRDTHRAILYERSKEYFRRYPWALKWRNIHARVHNKNSYYYKNGIKNFLRIRDVKELWFRDRAYLLKEPSIDRIDTHAHYTKENCQFIELQENKIKDSRGEQHSQHKLTILQVLEIRKSKLSDIKLGKQFGVSRTTIYDIRKRNSWKYI